jgi:hypothetical protein
MKVKSKISLFDHVRIRRHFQKSVRLDADFGRLDALDGYICHRTAMNVLDSMTRQINGSEQRAFTWTGPYGSGKSSLAVALASALSPDKILRSKSRKALQVDGLEEFDKAFPVSRGWLIVPVVGKRGSVSREISKILAKVSGSDELSRAKSSSTLISDLCNMGEGSGFDGVLLIIDEMGKFLEASALGSGDDVYFFQDLAEIAARSSGRVVVIGILHQSFRQYAARLGPETRDDWSKVQGRFSDIPIITGTDEIVELIGRAIETENHHPGTLRTAKIVAESMRKRRPTIGDSFTNSLDACWPLHPAMAALIGSVSKRQYGQNERSAFGFLGSAEPYGFQAFLHANPSSGQSLYRPDNYWNYLRANLELAILASPDGHRWSQAVDAIERAESKGANVLDVSLIKSIAIIDLFRNGSGLAAEEKVLLSLFDPSQEKEVKASLDKLEKWKVVLYKKHIGAWSVFEGSDFDIEMAISQARASIPGIDFKMLTQLANLYPALAKRHYHKTGAFRWMEVALCSLDEVEQVASGYSPRKGEFGLFLLALPHQLENPQAASQKCDKAARLNPWPVIVGVPENYTRLYDLGFELLALQAVETRPELQGDSVARREIKARIEETKTNLQEHLKSAVANAKWHFGDLQVQKCITLSPLASDLADIVYSKAPKVWSELVNRENLSPNSVKARRDLLQKMLLYGTQARLGIEGFPAEGGLYETLLKETGLHRIKPGTNHWGFLPPVLGSGNSFIDLWEATLALFKSPEIKVNVDKIFALWSNPPFGLRKGLHPVIFIAFIMANKTNIALYKDGLFIPGMTDIEMDEFLQDQSRFSLRWITIDKDKARILSGISNILHNIGRSGNSEDPLDAARSLVSMVLSLSAWSQRTQSLSKEAKAVRDMLLRADDPHKVLFVDLPSILGTESGDSLIEALKLPIFELAHSYKVMLDQVEKRMLDALDASIEDLKGLRVRAETLSQATGDLRQDAFAANLARYDGSQASLEALLSLAVNKPPRDWNDRDIDAALMELSKFSLRFRQTEALVGVRGRKPNSDAFAVVIGAGSDAKTFSRQFDLPNHHRPTIESLAEKLVNELKAKGLKTEVILAALAHAGLRLATSEEKELVND